MESLGEAVQCICSSKGALLALPYAQGPGQCELLKDRTCPIPLSSGEREPERPGRGMGCNFLTNWSHLRLARAVLPYSLEEVQEFQEGIADQLS